MSLETLYSTRRLRKELNVYHLTTMEDFVIYPKRNMQHILPKHLLFEKQ